MMTQINAGGHISPEYQKKLERLRPIDDEFMRCLFRDNLPLARQVLPVMTEDADIKIVSVETQADMKIAGARSIELDVLCGTDDKRIFDLEVERASGRGKPKRARYHASVLDVMNLRPREDFEQLPETNTIFLMEKDIFGDGLPRYHVDRVIREQDRSFHDRSNILYLNAQYRDDTPIGRLMADFMETDPEKMYTEELRKACYMYKRTEEGQKKMSQVFDEIREEGIKEGIKEGRKAGIKKGRKAGKRAGLKEGTEKALIKSIRNLMESMKMTASQAMEALGIEPKDRPRLMSLL